MSLMLVAIFAAVGLGMFVKGDGRRETTICVLIAVTLTFVYFFRPLYMT